MNSLDRLLSVLQFPFRLFTDMLNLEVMKNGKYLIDTWYFNRCQTGKVCICLRKQSAEKETFDEMFRQMRLAWASDANLIMFHCQTSHQSFFNFRLNSLWHRKLKYEIGDIICYITCLSLFNFLPHQSPFPFCFYLPFLISLYLLCLSY